MNLIKLIIENIFLKLNKNELFKLVFFLGISFLTYLLIRELDSLSTKCSDIEIYFISIAFSYLIIAIIIWLLKNIFKIRKNTFVFAVTVIVLFYTLFFLSTYYEIETLIALFLLLFIIIGLIIIQWVASKF